MTSLNTDKKPDKNKRTIILGCPRSGTTLLRRLLNSHPDISCPGETMLFRACAGFFEHDILPTGNEFGTLIALENTGFEREEILARLRNFAFGFYDEIAARENTSHWVAKTATDSFYMPQIEALFKDHAKFIIMLRHGLDVVCSLHEFTQNLQVYIKELHAYIRKDPRPYVAFARAWADVTTGLLDFAETYPDRCHVMSYESLVESPKDELQKITAFMNLPTFAFDPKGALSGKADGFGDWKAYKKTSIDTKSKARWQQDLPAVTVETLAPVVNPVLDRAGYGPVNTGDSHDRERRQEIARMMMQAQDPEQ